MERNRLRTDDRRVPLYYVFDEDGLGGFPKRGVANLLFNTGFRVAVQF